MRVQACACMAGLLLGSATLGAQATSPSRGIEWSWTPYVGYGQNSPAGNDWGVTPDWNHLFFGVHLKTAVLRFPPLVMSYAPGVLPLLRLTHHPSEGTPAQAPIYATGVSPFGFELSMDFGSRVTIYGASALGALFSTRDIPVRNARSMNVALERGGGVEISMRGSQALQLGYKFHHISNAHTAIHNPGLDGNVFYAGWRTRSRVGR